MFTEKIRSSTFFQAEFSDVICEPAAVHSPECAYKFTKTVYHNTTFATYSLLTLLFGGFLSFFYGLVYGFMSFIFVWFFTPLTRAFLVPLRLMGKIWLIIVKCFFDPLHESCGRIFFNMNINFNHRKIQNV